MKGKGETCCEREREGRRESKEREEESEQLTATFCRLFNEILERFDRQSKNEKDRKRKRGEREDRDSCASMDKSCVGRSDFLL